MCSLFLKNVQFIIGSVKVAEWPPFAITKLLPQFMLSHNILCSLCKWSYVLFWGGGGGGGCGWVFQFVTA